MALPAGAQIKDPFAEKEGGMSLGSLAKNVLAGLGIILLLIFFVTSLMIRQQLRIKEIKMS